MNAAQRYIGIVKDILKPDNIPGYFKEYMNDIIDVCRLKGDGGFEESMKYFLASQLLKKGVAQENLLAGTTPKNEEIKKKLEQATKPDLVILEAGEPLLFLELKTAIKAAYRNTFLLASDGTEKNHRNKTGDYHNLASRRSHFPNAQCFLMLFYLESKGNPQKEPENWASQFFAQEAGKSVSLPENLLMHTKADDQLWCRLIEVFH